MHRNANAIEAVLATGMGLLHAAASVLFALEDDTVASVVQMAGSVLWLAYATYKASK